MNTATKKEEAPAALARSEADTAKQFKRKYSRRSTATEAQIERLIEMLRARPHHTHELRKFGISHPAGRVQNLEEMGFVIESTRITTIDSDGFPHINVALYSLISEPDEKEAA